MFTSDVLLALCLDTGILSARVIIRRPKKTWREIVQKDCQARKLNREGAMHHDRWRKQIRVVDDHDRCEWVNVSSGTGSPR